MGQGMMEIDGAMGEGGGQVLRSSLALAACTGTGLRIHSIRANRAKPGLLRQHLTAVEAAAAICGAQVSGARLGSREVEFVPGPVRAGAYRFDIGTAGSSTLVLQTVLMPLLFAEGGGRSTVVVTGGTDNPMAPPAGFLERAFLPCLRTMGADVDVQCTTRGFYPVGGGEVQCTIRPTPLRPTEWMTRGAIRRVHAEAVVSRLSLDIARRELRRLQKGIGWSGMTRSEQKVQSPGPGNAVQVTVESEGIVEVFSSVGERRLRAEAVADRAAKEVCAYMESGVAVGEHLADQLLLPLALAGGGAFSTVAPSLHTRTNAEVIQRFLPLKISVAPGGGEVGPHGGFVVRVGAAQE